MTDSATCSWVGLTVHFSSSVAPKGASVWVMDGLGSLLAREQGAV